MDPVEASDERERLYGTAYGDALKEAMEANELTVLTIMKRWKRPPTLHTFSDSLTIVL